MKRAIALYCCPTFSCSVSTFFLRIGNAFVDNPFLIGLDSSASVLFLRNYFCRVFFLWFVSTLHTFVNMFFFLFFLPSFFPFDLFLLFLLSSVSPPFFVFLSFFIALDVLFFPSFLFLSLFSFPCYFLKQHLWKVRFFKKLIVATFLGHLKHL